MITYEADPVMRAAARRIALLNKVEPRVDARGLGTPAIARARTPARSTRVCVVMDCEGSEADLVDIDAVPWLARASLLVELGTVPTAPTAAARPLLERRLSGSHELRIVRGEPPGASRFPELWSVHGLDRSTASWSMASTARSRGVALGGAEAGQRAAAVRVVCRRDRDEGASDVDRAGAGPVQGDRGWRGVSPAELEAAQGRTEAGVEIQAKLGFRMVATRATCAWSTRAGAGSRMLKKAMTSEGTDLMKVSGSGGVFLADMAQEIQLLRLENESITANGPHVLAFEAGIDWDIKRVEGPPGARRGPLQHAALGDGSVALVSDGTPLLIEIDGESTYADPQAAITWSEGVSSTVKTDVNVRTPIGRGSGETIQLAFSGNGWLLIQPSEGGSPHRRRRRSGALGGPARRRLVAPIRRPFPRSVADASQEGRPYGRWEERLRGVRRRVRAARLRGRLDARSATVKWFRIAAGRAPSTCRRQRRPSRRPTRTARGRSPSTSAGSRSGSRARTGSPRTWRRGADFTDVTAAANPGWKIDLNDDVIGRWRTDGGRGGDITLIWGLPLIRGAVAVTAELDDDPLDQAPVADGRFTLVAVDAVSGFGDDLFLEVKLWGRSMKLLASESLYAEADAEPEPRRGVAGPDGPWLAAAFAIVCVIASAGAVWLLVVEDSGERSPRAGSAARGRGARVSRGRSGSPSRSAATCSCTARCSTVRSPTATAASTTSLPSSSASLPYVRGADLGAFVISRPPMGPGPPTSYPIFNTPRTGLAAPVRSSGWTPCSTAPTTRRLGPRRRARHGLGTRGTRSRAGGTRTLGEGRREPPDPPRRRGQARLSGLHRCDQRDPRSRLGVGGVRGGEPEAGAEAILADAGRAQGAEAVIVNLHWGDDLSAPNRPSSRSPNGSRART